jgi:hypothetical protein
MPASGAGLGAEGGLTVGNASRVSKRSSTRAAGGNKSRNKKQKRARGRRPFYWLCSAGAQLKKMLSQGLPRRKHARSMQHRESLHILAQTKSRKGQTRNRDSLGSHVEQKLSFHREAKTCVLKSVCIRASPRVSGERRTGSVTIFRWRTESTARRKKNSIWDRTDVGHPEQTSISSFVFRENRYSSLAACAQRIVDCKRTRPEFLQFCNVHTVSLGCWVACARGHGLQIFKPSWLINGLNKISETQYRYYKALPMTNDVVRVDAMLTKSLSLSFSTLPRRHGSSNTFRTCNF